MYTCAERERTKNLRIRRGYKGTKSVSGGEGDLIWSDTESEREAEAERDNVEQVMRDEGNKNKHETRIISRRGKRCMKR